MTLGTYSVREYDAMFADRTRTGAHLAAIEQVVRPGDVVVEVGTGTGYFAVAAARAGAARVYAIERANTIELAEAVVRENGFADRVTCLRGDAASMILPERGTVLLCDLRGAMPLYVDAIPTILAVRERLLVPGARLIPVRDVIYAAPCGAPSRWLEASDALGDTPYGIKRTAVSRLARSSFSREDVDAAILLADAAELLQIDYATVADPDVDSRARWKVTKPGVAEGIAVWFDARLAEGIGFGTAPWAPKTAHGQGFLPFATSIHVREGDEVALRFRAFLVEGAYAFAWETDVRRPGEIEPIASLRQSSLDALGIAPGAVLRRKASRVPSPGDVAMIRELVALIDGGRSVGDCAAAIYLAHPNRFATAEQALHWTANALAVAEDLNTV